MTKRQDRQSAEEMLDDFFNVYRELRVLWEQGQTAYDHKRNLKQLWPELYFALEKLMYGNRGIKS